MKKPSPVWLLFVAALILVPATINIGAGASTPVDGHIIGRRNSAQIQAAPLTFTVTTTADSGPGSFRAAIDQANTNPGLDTINFNLGAGTPTIMVGSLIGAPLPALTEAVTIDGATGGATRIELDGTAAGVGADGLTLMASNITVRGLVINRFSGNGITINQGSNIIQGNLIGTNATGTAASPNAGSGVLIDMSSSGNTIGGTAIAARNVISGNSGAGVFLSGSNSNQITGNFIGTDITGAVALGNSSSGVNLLGSSSNNSIGGTAPGAGNTIAFNSFSGIFIAAGAGNSVLGNSFSSNGTLGIDLNDDGGVTPNDMCDGDGGANLSQNFPDLTSAQSAGGMITITGNLNSTQNTTFRVEFFSNNVCDGSGNGEGQVFIGSTNVTTPAAGCDAPISVVLSVAVPVGAFVTATATDPSNNTSEFSHCVTVTAAACTITCPANQMKSNDPNLCGASVNYPPPTTSGACGSVACNPPGGSFFPAGVTVVTCATTAGPSCTFTVTVNDTQPPTITCPADITRNTASNQCAAVVAYPPPTVVDNCPGSAASCNPPSGSTFPKGMTAVNCSASDGSGNVANCSFTVTVNDTTPPTITCQPNQSVASSVPTAVNYPAPSAADNCPGVTSSCNPPSGSVFPVGTTMVTCTATDTSANNTACIFTVTVAPCTITCPNDVMAHTGTNATCGSTVSYPPPDVAGGCGPATCTPASGSFFAVGARIVTCTIPGGPNCSFTVIVVDDTAPRIVCPNSIVTAPLPGQSSAVVNYPPATATDNCPGAMVQCSPQTGSHFPLGTTFVTCTATDSSSNSAACVFSVIVVDSEPPVITCPANVAVGTPSGQTSAVVTYPAPNVSDNSAVVTTICLPASGSSFPLGVTTVTCTATDVAGNKSSCSFTVSVGGPQPRVVIPGNKAVVEFGNPSPVSPARKPPKAKKNPCGLFAVQNIGFAPLVLTLDSITRTGSDVDSRKIADANDTKYFSLSLLASDGSSTSLDLGGVVTIQPGGAQSFCLRFNALIPALAGKTTGIAAADALPDTVTSLVTFRQNAGSPVTVPVLAHLATGVIFINATNPRQPPTISFTRSGNNITVSYALYDPNLNVTRAKYEFLGSGGQVVGSAFEIDLAEQLRALSLVRGQSFSVEQRFTGASDHPEIVGVRVTVFDGETSVTDSATAGESVTTASIRLLNRSGDAKLYLPVLRQIAPLP
jgi:HYR domain/Right handed beta helix region